MALNPELGLLGLTPGYPCKTSKFAPVTVRLNPEMRPLIPELAPDNPVTREVHPARPVGCPQSRLGSGRHGRCIGVRASPDRRRARGRGAGSTFAAGRDVRTTAPARRRQRLAAELLPLGRAAKPTTLSAPTALDSHRGNGRAPLSFGSGASAVGSACRGQTLCTSRCDRRARIGQPLLWSVLRVTRGRLHSLTPHPRRVPSPELT
jgi:hypothetical protein